MIEDDVVDGVLDRLIEALAAQVEIAESRSLAPGAVAALTVDYIVETVPVAAVRPTPG